MDKNLTLSTRSWHYRLANVYWVFSPIENFTWPTICSYLWRVLGGLIVAFCVFIGALAVSFCVLDFALWALVVYQYNVFIDVTETAGVGAVLVLLATVAGLIAGGTRLVGGSVGDHVAMAMLSRVVERCLDWMETPSEKSASPFLIAYRSFKDKVCLKIDFKD